MVISTFNPGWDKADIRALFLKGHAAIVAGVKQAGVPAFWKWAVPAACMWHRACN
jgi:hypothetical protein